MYELCFYSSRHAYTELRSFPAKLSVWNTKCHSNSLYSLHLEPQSVHVFVCECVCTSSESIRPDRMLITVFVLALSYHTALYIEGDRNVAINCTQPAWMMIVIKIDHGENWILLQLVYMCNNAFVQKPSRSVSVAISYTVMPCKI